MSSEHRSGDVVDVADDLADADGAEDAGGPAAGTGVGRVAAVRRSYVVLVLVTGVLGTFASLELMLDHIRILADPDFTPACDINPLIGCGIFLESWQAKVFGIPNPVLGLLTFPVVLTTGVLLASRVRLPRWYWRCLLAGATLGIAFVTWLQVAAITQIGALCPYCLVVWAVVIPFFVHTVAATMAGGALPAGEGLRSFVTKNAWLITALWYLLVVAGALFGLGDAWLTVF